MNCKLRVNAAELFVKCLENEDVEYIFGMAGEENLHILEAIRKSKPIRYIPVRHEQAAGFMAATYGRLTGKVGVALSTLGPGATNFATAAAYAKLGAFPTLFITGQKPIRHNTQGNFQIVDIVEMMKPLTEKTISIGIADKIPAMVRELFRTAMEERPGPVHLEIPKDISLDSVTLAPFPFDPKVRRPVAEDKAISKAVSMIQTATKPVLLVGASANRKHTSKMLTEFIKKTGIYFVDTQMGKGVIDERNSRFIGTAALTAKDIVHEALQESDLIINVGHDVIEKSPFVMNRESGQKVIHINYFGAEVHNFYFPQLEVIGDIANAVWQIKEKLDPAITSWDFSNFEITKTKIETKVFADTNPEGKQSLTQSQQYSAGIKPQHIVGVVRSVMSSDDIVALDNGMYKLWFTRYFKAHSQNSILVDNALATMGAGLPSAIAAKLVNPDRRVLAVVGDGGFMMNSQELETAIRLELDLTVLLINDSGLGMIQWEQDEKNYQSFGLKHGNPDFVKYAESYGANGYRVRNSSELRDILSQLVDAGGVNLIDCAVDYSENDKIFTKILRS